MRRPLVHEEVFIPYGEYVRLHVVDLNLEQSCGLPEDGTTLEICTTDSCFHHVDNKPRVKDLPGGIRHYIYRCIDIEDCSPVLVILERKRGI